MTVMAGMEADSVDAVVTDPPYGLEFMGKGWDRFVPSAKFGTKVYKDGSTASLPNFHGADNPTCRNCGGLQSGSDGKKGQKPCRCDAPRFDTANSLRRMRVFQQWCEAWGREALRVTKPGGYLLAFGGTRTHHRLVCGLEDAGWIIRDELTWVYASGFPKGKANLKPAHEPIVLARKPGPLRPLAIDACRIGTTDDLNGGAYADNGKRVDLPGAVRSDAAAGMLAPGTTVGKEFEQPTGRWPSNVLLSDPALFDEPNPEVVGSGAVTNSPATYERNVKTWDSSIPPLESMYGLDEAQGYGDSGGYSRFFIIPKADRADREPVLRGQLEATQNSQRYGSIQDGRSSSGEPYDREAAWSDNVYCNCETDKPEWVSEARRPRGRTASTSRSRATSEATSTDGFDWPTSPRGSGTSVPSPLDDSSTTSMATSRTTESPTSRSSTPSPTSVFTPGASSSTASGGSGALSAASTENSPLNGGTSAERDGRSMADADLAISPESSETSVCGDCGKLRSTAAVGGADGVTRAARRNSHPT